MSAALVRSFQSSDRAAIGEIAYQTGFFGDSAARFFPPQRLFEVLWVEPYFQTAGAVGFVAVLNGRVVGYIIGTTSERAYRWAVTRTVLTRSWRVLPSLSDLLVSLKYLWRAARFAPPHGDWEQYPAHLHINLLPEARGHRLGEQLLQAFLNELTARGVRGVQLSTTLENHAALHLYRKFGFQVLVSKVTPLWTPWLGRPVEHVIMGRSVFPAGAQG